MDNQINNCEHKQPSGPKVRGIRDRNVISGVIRKIPELLLQKTMNVKLMLWKQLSYMEWFNWDISTYSGLLLLALKSKIKLKGNVTGIQKVKTLCDISGSASGLKSFLVLGWAFFFLTLIADFGLTVVLQLLTVTLDITGLVYNLVEMSQNPLPFIIHISPYILYLSFIYIENNNMFRCVQYVLHRCEKKIHLYAKFTCSIIFASAGCCIWPFEFQMDTHQSNSLDYLNELKLYNLLFNLRLQSLALLEHIIFS